MLRRVQLVLDRELDDALAREARRAGISKSELARRILRERLEPVPPLEDDPLWELVGIVAGASNDSARVDDVVYPR
ncbi:MAG: ribbon-helix-helix protein, CopG family [Thermoleophilia bacterium]|nr:ribbon-helix-helix protein, CopG family [Thermoleophilia bacterium]